MYTCLEGVTITIFFSPAFEAFRRVSLCSNRHTQGSTRQKCISQRDAMVLSMVSLRSILVDQILGSGYANASVSMTETGDAGIHVKSTEKRQPCQKRPNRARHALFTTKVAHGSQARA